MLTGLRFEKFSHFRLQDQLLFAGILGQVGFQAIENIGAALSMLPLTGITLPLISYGLSSLVMTLTTLGLAPRTIQSQTP